MLCCFCGLEVESLERPGEKLSIDEMLLDDFYLEESLDEVDPEEDEKGDPKNCSTTMDDGSMLETSRCSTRMKRKTKRKPNPLLTN